MEMPKKRPMHKVETRIKLEDTPASQRRSQNQETPTNIPRSKPRARLVKDSSQASLGESPSRVDLGEHLGNARPQYSKHQQSLQDLHNQAPPGYKQKPKNGMAYININSDGQRLVGPLGMKKAEQDLIKRRYKQHHYP